MSIKLFKKKKKQNQIVMIHMDTFTLLYIPTQILRLDKSVQTGFTLIVTVFASGAKDVT